MMPEVQNDCLHHLVILIIFMIDMRINKDMAFHSRVRQRTIVISFAS